MAVGKNVKQWHTLLNEHRGQSKLPNSPINARHGASFQTDFHPPPTEEALRERRQQRARLQCLALSQDRHQQQRLRRLVLAPMTD